MFLQNPSSFYLIVTQTPEDGPKYSVLHGVGLPVATDLDATEVKTKNLEKSNWLEPELNLGKRAGIYSLLCLLQ